MQVRSQSNKSFSNNSYQNWQSKRCDFCMYHDIIFEQLERLKEAVTLKNQRIQELEQFIKKISQMAFVKSPVQAINTSKKIEFEPKRAESIEEVDNQDSLKNIKNVNPMFFKKRFEESSQISFRDSKQNTAKFETRIKESSDLNSRFQRINHLNELKKELRRSLQESISKEQSSKLNQTQSVDNIQQFDTLRSLSQPQEQGQVASIHHSSCQNSRIAQFTDRNLKYTESMMPIQLNRDILVKPSDSRQLKLVSSRNSNDAQDKTSLNLIKEYLKKMK